MTTRQITACDSCGTPITGKGIAVHLEMPDSPGASWTVLTQRRIDVHGLPCLAAWVSRESNAAPATVGNGHAPSGNGRP